ncbi:septal ring lytic transglycosylase RlpA family protein [Notoacmeibacter ruber]|uniref:Endolytic peptidoglycan transglycosylase RlpA n=1 Tax=Notoacmeibacter ruber TaxID=2670375 RepID=A0A3L7J801_9HYPH|nr:septal ring lytic transglycosylase RlpA family protein [Notoacmeibacter ruber]RLQ86857.1 septal ring lytic transglycosylase RlpA family protein [Notoacmeibacter ruber]
MKKTFFAAAAAAALAFSVAAPAQAACGKASWYGPGFHGKKTASGEAFNQNAMTAAHKTLPLGSKVRVTNERNGRSIVVRINDRGPYAHGRVLDLSKGAAAKLGFIRAGHTSVCYSKA